MLKTAERRQNSKPETRNSKPIKQQGIALILTLWILVILSVMVFEFTYRMRLEAEITLNSLRRVEAYWLARAGINRGIALLKKDINEYDPPDEEWASPVQEDLGTGSYEVRLTDEEAKININEVPFRILANLEGVDMAVGESILDFRDVDEEKRENGAETPYYQELDKPYQAKNRFFDSLNELQLVKGVSEELWANLKDSLTVYGKININFASLDVLETLMAARGIELSLAKKIAGEIVAYRKTSAGKASFTDIAQLGTKVKSVSKEVYEKIADYITVEGRININTAPRKILAAYLKGLEVPEKLADEIVNHRPFTSADQLQELPLVATSNLYAKIRDYLTVRSKYFTIESVGRLKESPISEKIRAVVKREQDEEGNWRVVIIYWHRSGSW